MNDATQPIAGPSSLPAATNPIRNPKTIRKPRAPHPDNPRPAKRSRPPPLPAPPLHPSRPGGTSTTHPHLPIKVLQGVGARRTDSTKNGYGKEVILVTRKTTLGAYMGRCRSLVIDEGYTHLVLHSLGAAIPHCLLLLHAVLDTLPYPRGPRGLWYEIHTGTSECVDQIEVEDPSRPIEKLPKKGKKGKEVEKEVDGGEKDEGGDVDMTEVVEESPEKGEKAGEGAVPAWLAGIGSVEASAPIKKVRLTSSMKIDIYIGPKPAVGPAAPSIQPRQSKPGESRNRPSKKKRQAHKTARELENKVKEAQAAAEDMDEEGMNNGVDGEEGEAEEEMEVIES